MARDGRAIYGRYMKASTAPICNGTNKRGQVSNGCTASICIEADEHRRTSDEPDAVNDTQNRGIAR